MKESTKVVCKSSEVTVSMIVPLYNTVLDHLDEGMRSNNDKMKRAAEAASSKMLKYYNRTSNTYSIATVLDPRFNIAYYKATANNDNCEDPRKIEELVVDKIKSNYNQFITEHHPGSSLGSKNDFISSIFSASSAFAEESPEWKRYCSLQSESKNVDPLAWWKVHQDKYPALAKMAKDYLAIPATSVNSERAFSSSGQTVTCNRYSLSNPVIRALQCLKSWNRFFKNIHN